MTSMSPQTLPASVKSLPIAGVAENVVDALKNENVLLHAEPGAGKSTGLPLWLLHSQSVSGRIILLEPRRVAARSVAERLASHFGEKVGQQIGLRMRSDTRVSKATRLEVVTEGVLTRLLQSDPTLEGVSLIVFDEYHERSLQADLGLVLCLEIQREVRSDLRLLLMSATLDVMRLSPALESAVSLHCPVRQYPVDINFTGDSKEPLLTRVVPVVIEALRKEAGDILVFLPGVAEINRISRMLTERLDETHTIVLPLHSNLGAKQQRLALAPAQSAQRRIILATSIAETSVTIDGVRVVIDSGLERRGKMDASSGAQFLETVMASQASATQRSGRAGRTSPGVSYRLWGEQGHVRRAAHWQPEIMRADLAPLMMELGQWGARDVNDLAWPDPPPESSVSRAQDLLTNLGLWKQDALTVYGQKVARLPGTALILSRCFDCLCPLGFPSGRIS